MQNLSISPSDFNLPGYRFDRFIGKGSYATVYKARALNEDFGVYAIKVIERASLVKHDVDNLMNEIGILKTLKHPNIVKMKDFHWDTKYVYIVTEFCEGGDLSVFIKKRQRLPEKVCLKFLRQLATGLHYLRSNNISHFDLKPKNLLLKMKPVVTLKIADFGFAQCISEEMKQFVMKGSPLYMAPEMLQCKPCDAKVDLWSVGVIYYECLYGQPPFANYSFDELTVMFTDKTVVKIPVDPAVSPKSRQLLACLLECNAARRIDFDVFFAHPLIEVAHAASPRTYAHGVRLAAEAVRLDQLRRLPEAVDLYIDALSYLVPHVKLEEDEEKKAALKARLRQYLDRAEALLPVTKHTEMHPTSSLATLRSMCKSTPVLADALDTVATAEMYVAEGYYVAAYGKLEYALNVLIDALMKEPPGPRRQHLHVQVLEWLNQATRVRALIDASENEFLSEVELLQNRDDSKVCSLQ